jgi:hypothetical protein
MSKTKQRSVLEMERKEDSREKAYKKLLKEFKVGALPDSYN